MILISIFIIDFFLVILLYLRLSLDFDRRVIAAICALITKDIVIVLIEEVILVTIIVITILFSIFLLFFNVLFFWQCSVCCSCRILFL